MKMPGHHEARTRARNAVAAPLAALLPALLAMTSLALIAGCSHFPRPHWPWQRTPTPPPQPVHELVITSPGGSTVEFPQYWKGNTLVVDMQSASGSGSLVLQPREHTMWPVRIAFRVLPGRFGVLEVRAQQRVVLPITTAGTRPVDLELAPGVFLMKTPRINVSWGPADQSPGR